MSMSNAESPDAKVRDLQQPPDKEFKLDSIGDMKVVPELRALVEEETKFELRARWPKAVGTSLDTAVSDVVQFRLHTLETGGLNYQDARVLGEDLIQSLGPPQY
jgi:hypothetical protein